MSQSGENKPSLPQADKAEQASSNEKPDVTEVSTEKAQAGDASQAEKGTKEKATAGITDKKKASTSDLAQAEEKKPADIDPAQVDANIIENKEDPSQLKNETAEVLSQAKEANALEEGDTLEVESLAKAPMAFGVGAGNPQKTREVKSFEELKKAITDAGKEPTVNKITESFTLTEALTIGKNQDITLTANNKRTEETWEPIKNPADYADRSGSSGESSSDRLTGQWSTHFADSTWSCRPSSNPAQKKNRWPIKHRPSDS